MAFEQEPRATFVEGSENRILESEEVKVTPPARRKKAEKMKNKVGSKPPLRSEEVMTSDCCSNTLPVEFSLKQGVGEENNEVTPQGNDMNFKPHETKNGVLKDSCTDEDSANEARANVLSCVENSYVKPNDLAAYANETDSVQSSNESEAVKEDLNLVSERKDDLESPVGFENSRESCKSLDISATAISQDEESFFSADEAETSREVQSSTLYELTETVNETELEGALSVNIESTNTKKEVAILDEDRCQETSQALIIANCDQRSTFEVSKESLHNPSTSGFQESAKEPLSTEPSPIESSNSEDVSKPVIIGDQDSHLSVDIDLGATGGAVESDSDTDEEWSSSSYTSSEGEYDVSFAEVVCGIEEDQDSDQDTCTFKDGVEEILSAFPNNYFTQIVSVTTDSEDDSNKGDSLNNTLKTTEESLAENNFSPLNIMSDEDENDTGEQILSHFPQSECPVIVDITGNDPALSIDGNTGPVLAKDKYRSIDDERTLADDTTTLEGVVLTEDSGHQGTENVSVTEAVEADHQICKNVTVSDTVDADQTRAESVMEVDVQERKEQPIERTGSFRLINNDGVLKVVDSGKTPVTTENVKEARLLKTKSLKGASTKNGVNQSESDSAEARKQLGNTVSEVKELDIEFQNVCKNIAALERMTSVEGVEKTTETEGEANKGDLVDGDQDSGTVIISIVSMTTAEQRPEIRLEGSTTTESMTDEQEDSAQEHEINGVTDETDTSSSNTTKKRPKRLQNTNRYSLGTESALLSPEDDNLVELTNFGSSSSIKSNESPVSTSDSQTDIVSTVSTDGQQNEEATPSPPPRTPFGRHKNLMYSGSFNCGVSSGPSRPLPAFQSEGSKRLSRRPRSERSKTMPNNVFDVASDKFSRFFTSSSSSEPIHQGPITLITDNMPATFTGFPINRRAQVALELYTTERSYVRGLETILQLFKKPCEENKLLDKKESHTMFSNIQDIFSVNKDVLFMLLERVSHWHDQQCLGDIFADQSYKIIDRMKIYAKYCNNYDSAEALYKQKIKKKEFESFINTCYEHQVCQPGLNLPAYLITVVQRIPRYLLLLEDFFKRTPENHPDHGNLSKALTRMTNLAVYINNQLQTTVGQKAMVDLRSRVEGLKAFEAPGRALIKEADVVLAGSRKTRKCLLFNDMLVFAIKGVTKTSEVEQTLELVTLWCMDLEGNNPQSAKEDSLEIYTPEQSYILDAGTKTEKKVWLQKLRTRIAMALHGAEATEKNEIESRKANFTYKDGRIFSGNFVSGKRHGEGTLSWPNQAKYQGLWEDDERNGWGELTYNSGDKYRGEWLDDKQHGVGTMEYTSGDVYNGEWYMGDIHGQGRISYKNGDLFMGEFCSNEIDGSGELSCVSGLTYKGEWKHSKKHGKGKMHFPNGDVYSGQFANDRISGQGEMQYADGSVYKGQWVDNQRGGSGVFSSSDGTHYDGGWSGDHITGKGRMTYSNGDCYDGNWFKNTRFGQGVMKYSNGDTYEGVFEYDLRSKHGKMTYKDGSEYEGSWANGLRHGKGKMFYSHKKSKFEGEWMLGLRHGEGVLTFANEASYSGRWEFDKQNGRGMYTDPSTGYRYEGEWQNGLKHGKGVEQTTEGRYEGEWKDNMRHGQGREVLSCETEFEGRWKENRKHGQGIKKLKTGRIEEQVWHEGKHVDVSSVVVIELPLIQRR